MSAVVHSDPEILGGTPVFRGTRVPAQPLMPAVLEALLWAPKGKATLIG